jgi:hypothetical protein
MTTVFRRILDIMTPWHNDHVVNERIAKANEQIVRSVDITDRTDRIIKQYVLMDTMYRKRSKTP